MKRSNFLKSLIGLVALPEIAKVLPEKAVAQDKSLAWEQYHKAQGFDSFTWPVKGDLIKHKRTGNVWWVAHSWLAGSRFIEIVSLTTDETVLVDWDYDGKYYFAMYGSMLCK